MNSINTYHPRKVTSHRFRKGAIVTIQQQIQLVNVFVESPLFR